MTIKEIAELAGVSISTVSKIINNKDQNIHPTTRERVLKIVKEYNYTPYETIKQQSTSKSFIIGVLLRSSNSSSSILYGILQTAQAHGYNIMLLDSNDDPQQELQRITKLCHYNVDGVIWDPVNTSSHQHQHHFVSKRIPFCFMNNLATDSSFHIDFKQFGYCLTKKLLEYRHTKIACPMKKDSLRSEQIFEGFKQCLFDHQIPFNSKMQIDFEDDDCYKKIIAGHSTSVVATHYYIALKLYERMSLLHYRIPRDLSIVAPIEEKPSDESFPFISGIPIPYVQFGSYICENLIQHLEQTVPVPQHFCSSMDFNTECSIEIPSAYRFKKIIVVGNINTDHIFNVEQIPQLGKTTKINSLTTSLGGKGANQAVGAAKLGRDVSLISEIGYDTDSEFIISTLEKNHVDTNGIHRDIKLPTGRAYIYVDETGESMITIFSGANQNLTAERVRQRRHLFENASYCLMSTEIHRGTILETAIIAKQHGVKTILKPSTLKHISPELIPYIDILVPNRKEAALLCPNCETVEQQATHLFDLGIHTVIITLGHNGCYLKTETLERYFPASNAIPVDTTGGADAFISALTTYLTEGYSLENAIQIATYAAGFCISRQGVVPALVDRNTLDAHIRKLAPHLLYSSAE